MRLKKIDRPDCVEDCIKVRSVLESFGYSVTLDDACDFWQELSSNRACSWRVLPEDEKLLRYIIGVELDEVEFDEELNDRL